MIDHTHIHKRTIREKALYFVKIIAPLVAMVLLAFLLLWPMIHKSSNTKIHTTVDTGEYADLKTSVTNSLMVGMASSGDTYQLHTDKIYKYIDDTYKNDDTYHLIHANLLQNFVNGGVLKIRSSFGSLNRTKNLMYLSKGVYLLRNGQDKSYAEKIDIDIKNRFIHTKVPFVAWGPTSFFASSQGISYDLNNKIIILKGNSRVVLLNNTSKTDASTSTSTDKGKDHN